MRTTNLPPRPSTPGRHTTAPGHPGHGRDAGRTTRGELGERLRRRRIALGMSLDEAAERTGLACSDLRSMEGPACDVHPDIVLRYAAALGLRLSCA